MSLAQSAEPQDEKRLGKYTLLEKLGEGATGEVFHGRDPGLNRDVAIKVLKSGLVSDRVAFERFRSEARSAAQLFHPSIATVIELGEDEGRYYIVMRYIAGRSLDKVIKEGGPLAWDAALKMLQQVGAALDYSHGQHILHRDIKPGNILVTAEGDFVLTDFGLARALQETSGTSTGLVMGTPFYIAPELWDGAPASPASDQYALGCVAYEALTGRVLFKGDTPVSIMKKHVLDGARLDALPAGQAEVLRTALHKEPAGRYPSLKEFTRRLAESQAASAAPSSQTPSPAAAAAEHRPAASRPVVRPAASPVNPPGAAAPAASQPAATSLTREESPAPAAVRRPAASAAEKETPKPRPPEAPIPTPPAGGSPAEAESAASKKRSSTGGTSCWAGLLVVLVPMGIVWFFASTYFHVTDTILMGLVIATLVVEFALFLGKKLPLFIVALGFAVYLIPNIPEAALAVASGVGAVVLIGQMTRR